MAAIKCVHYFQQTFYRCAHTDSKRLFVNKLRWNISTRAFSNSDQEYHNLKTEEESFEQMLRNSQFVKLGRPRGKTVSGRIVHISGADNDDLYVDFGWKLHAVVKRPSSKKGRDYQVGSEVKLRIQDLEATGHFLGQSKRITMCEADAKLTRN